MDAPQAVRPVAATDSALIWFRRRRRNRLQRGVSALTVGVAVYGLAALLLAPLILFFAAGVWSSIVYTRMVISFWNLFTSGQFQAFLGEIASVDLAVRVAVASGAFFALLFALIVVFSGLLGRRWRRLLILPGLLLGVPALLAFLTGMQVATDALAAKLALPDLVAPLITIYALADLVVLSALLVDLRPRARRHRRARNAEQAAAPLRLVRFGPPLAPTISTATISAPLPAFVVAAVTAAEPDLYDETPSDPRMVASVAKALDESLPVAILPIAAAQRDDEVSRRDTAEVSE